MEREIKKKECGLRGAEMAAQNLIGIPTHVRYAGLIPIPGHGNCRPDSGERDCSEVLTL